METDAAAIEEMGDGSAANEDAVRKKQRQTLNVIKPKPMMTMESWADADSGDDDFVSSPLSRTPSRAPSLPTAPTSSLSNASPTKVTNK